MSLLDQPSVDGSDSLLSADVPVPASGLQLLGPMEGSGYRKPPSLVRRGDGQTLQLSALLYRVLENVDGQRDYAQIAAAVSADLGRTLQPDDARMLVESKLRPLGVVQNSDGSEPDARKSNPLLALRFKLVISNPRLTGRITAPFAWLLHPVFVVPIVLGFCVVTWWVLFRHGLGFAAHQAFTSPGLLLLVFAITVVSAGFHEFGHAAAARYGGATPGAMGAGLYLVWPAFYTDVTDSYRLGRGGRLRTDLGGLYFNALLSVAMFGLWWVTGWDALLLVVATQVLQMIRQLPPMIRCDGYHILADLTGVPDLFHRIGPTLKALIPGKKPPVQPLKPWARAVVTLWVLFVVPLMLLTILLTLITMPRLVASSAVSLAQQWSRMVQAFGQGHFADGAAGILRVLAVALPVLGVLYIVGRLVRRIATAAWVKTRGRPGRRAVAAILAAALVGGLVYVWWPRGNYHAIRAYEPGTIQSILPASYTTDAAGLAEGQQASAQTIWPSAGGPLPTADHPALSLVLVPHDKKDPTWVFPFNRPAPPGPGDNQSLAVNTTSGSAVYDVAFAMVWADSNRVLNKNEAYAFASCTGCSAIAISFQVVAIVGDAHVVVPQNISAAVNYNCVDCVTRALAVQLVVSLPANPSAAEKGALDKIWAAVSAFGAHLSGLSYSQIHDRIVAYERQIATVVHQYGTPVTSSTSSTSASSTPPSSTSDSTPATSSSSAGTSIAPAEGGKSSDTGGSSTSPAPTSPTASPSNAPTTTASTSPTG